MKLVCQECGGEFVSRKAGKVTCSQICFRARTSAAARKRWQDMDPDRRAALCAAMIEGTRKRWQDPARRAAGIEGIRKVWQSPAGRAVKMAKFTSPAYRALKAELSRNRWKNTAFRTAVIEGMRKAQREPAYRAAMSEAMRKRWQDMDPDRRAAAAERLIKRNLKLNALSAFGEAILQDEAFAFLADLSPDLSTLVTKLKHEGIIQ
jgi:hypothetical protein